MPEPAVLAEGLVKTYGSVRALDGVDLSVAEGSVLGLLGPNGAGKTTAVRILATLLRPDAGRAVVAGFDVARDPAKVRERIGLAGQYAAVDENLTGEGNLVMVGRLYHLGAGPAKERARELLERFDLFDVGQRRVKTYSGGLRRRLDLAAALVARPPIVFLDEPTTGLDPRSRIGLWDTIEGLVDGGTTVLLTTQYLDEADRLADRIAVIDHGKVIAEGTGDELKGRLGGDRLELRLEHAADAERAVAAVGGLGDGGAEADGDIVNIPVRERSGAVVAAVRRLDDASVGIVDVTLRRPTLDDVFLSLTGRPAEKGDDEAATPSPERGVAA